MLSTALHAVGPDNQRPPLTHGLHSYAARMPWAMARALVRGFAQHGQRILDPFCGSGTTLLEAKLRGCHAIGTDINPLALRISEARCTPLGRGTRQRLAQASTRVVRRTQGWIQDRHYIDSPLEASERRWYAPHTLRELACLHAAIQQESPRDQRLLLLMLSAIVTKFSKQRSDTRTHTVTKTLRKGLPTEFWARKVHELIQAHQQLSRALPSQHHAVRCTQDDACTLASLPDNHAVDCIITSPPYGGTYNYSDHHARRYPWLGIDTRDLAQQEIGARRDLNKGDASHHRIQRTWDEQLLASLQAMHRVLIPRGWAILVLGDAQLSKQRMPADQQLRRLAPQAGFEFVDSVSATRADWTGHRQARREHIIALKSGCIHS